MGRAQVPGGGEVPSSEDSAAEVKAIEVVLSGVWTRRLQRLRSIDGPLGWSVPSPDGPQPVRSLAEQVPTDPEALLQELQRADALTLRAYDGELAAELAREEHAPRVRRLAQLLDADPFRVELRRQVVPAPVAPDEARSLLRRRWERRPDGSMAESDVAFVHRNIAIGAWINQRFGNQVLCGALAALRAHDPDMAPAAMVEVLRRSSALLLVPAAMADYQFTAFAGALRLAPEDEGMVSLPPAFDGPHDARNYVVDIERGVVRYRKEPSDVVALIGSGASAKVVRIGDPVRTNRGLDATAGCPARFAANDGSAVSPIVEEWRGRVDRAGAYFPHLAVAPAAGSAVFAGAAAAARTIDRALAPGADEGAVAPDEAPLPLTVPVARSVARGASRGGRTTKGSADGWHL